MGDGSQEGRAKFYRSRFRYVVRPDFNTSYILMAAFAWILISIFAFAYFASRRFYVAWKEVAKEVGDTTSRNQAQKRQTAEF